MPKAAAARHERHTQQSNRRMGVIALAAFVAAGWTVVILYYASAALRAVLPSQAAGSDAVSSTRTGKRPVLRLLSNNPLAPGSADADEPDTQVAPGSRRVQEVPAAEEEAAWSPGDRMDPNALVDAVLWRPEFCDVPEGECLKKDDHATMLEKIKVWGGVQRTQPRLFCGIYTYHKNHDTRVKAVKETWASRCDGFVAFSDQADSNVPTVAIPHEGEESYDNMWQKSRNIWKYIHHHYRDDYDWFVLGGDDMWITAENLRKYLLSKELRDLDRPHYLGMRFKLPEGHIFNSGGAGAVLNAAAVKALAPNLDAPECGPHRKAFSEDVELSRCLEISGISAYETKDEKGEERFHPFSPGQHLQYRKPEGKDWYKEYAIDLKEGLDCCSEWSISWHYIDPALMRRIFHLLYTCKLF